MIELFALFQPIWLFAGLIAFILRLLILSKSPPKPVNVWQRLRDATISFILVAFSPPIIAAYDITVTAMHISFIVAILGPEMSFKLFKRILLGALHAVIDSDEKLKTAVLNHEQSEAFEKEK